MPRTGTVPRTAGCGGERSRTVLLANRRLGALLALVALAASTVALTTEAPAEASDLRSPVMGEATLSVEEVLAWMDARTRPEHRATVDREELIALFAEEGASEGVDWNVAVAQAILETAWFNYPDHGQVRPEDNNFGGMGAFDNSDGSFVFEFPDARTGVRAKMQHLRIYGDVAVAADGSNLASPIAVDVAEEGEEPRYPARWLLIRNGSGPDGRPYHASATAWQDLGNGLWATDPFYSCKVLNLYRQMLDFNGRDVTGLPTNPTCLRTWHLRLENRGGIADAFGYLGRDGDQVLACDTDGDGQDTPVTFRDGRWTISNLATGANAFSFGYGRAGDLPLCGDFNGDGRDTLGVVRDGTWLLRDTLTPGEADRTFIYGRVTRGDIPVVGDWNADGRDGIGIIREGEWHLRNTLSGGPAERQFTYGRILAGDRPVIGDWNGDGRDGVGIVRATQWHLRNTLTGGPAELQFGYGSVGAEDVPVVGDWNRDGRSTPGIVRR